MKAHKQPAIAFFACISIMQLALVQTSAAKPSLVTKRIMFESGAICWSYTGPANQFVGKFKKGQRISVNMIQRGGITPLAYGDLDGINVAIDDKLNPTGLLDFVAPRTGIYTFGFLPAIIWNTSGTVSVCAQ